MKKFVKIFAYVIIFTLFGAFIIRCIMVADKSTFAKPMMTAQMIDAYSDGAADGFVQTVDVAREMSEAGYFCAYGFYYVPAVSQAQVTVRWNDSAYTYTDMAEGTEFAFVLRNETTGEEFPAVAVEEKEKSIYNFRRLVIDNVTFGADDELAVVMLLRDGHTDRQIVRAEGQPVESYRLSGKELALLGGAEN